MKITTFFRAAALHSESAEGDRAVPDSPLWFANALRVAYGDAIPNAGRRVTDEQRKAIFARMGGGGGGGGGGGETTACSRARGAA